MPHHPVEELKENLEVLNPVNTEEEKQAKQKLESSEPQTLSEEDEEVSVFIRFYLTLCQVLVIFARFKKSAMSLFMTLNVLTQDGVSHKLKVFAVIIDVVYRHNVSS